MVGAKCCIVLPVLSLLGVWAVAPQMAPSDGFIARSVPVPHQVHGACLLIFKCICRKLIVSLLCLEN